MNKSDLHKAIKEIDTSKEIKNQAHKYVDSLEKSDFDNISEDAKEAVKSLIDAIIAEKEKTKEKKPSEPKKDRVGKVLSGKDAAPIIDPDGKDIVVVLPDTCKTPIRVRQKPDSKGSVTVAINNKQSHKLPSPPGFTDFYNTGLCNWSFIDKGI